MPGIPPSLEEDPFGCIPGMDDIAAPDCPPDMEWVDAELLHAESTAAPAALRLIKKRRVLINCSLSVWELSE